MKERAKAIGRVLAVCLVALLVCWLVVTRFQPHRFRPFGSLWWDGGVGIGRIVDTESDLKHRQTLRATLRSDSQSPRLRRLAVTGLARNPSATDLDAIVAALVADPAEDVRVGAAFAVWRKLPDEDDCAEAERAVRALGLVAAGDASSSVRGTAASLLESGLWATKKTRTDAFYDRLVDVAWPYALRAAEGSGDVRVRELADVLADELGREPVTDPDNE